ncbi:MAG: dockerin type I repeat-containing protein [Clostridiales Family XIII bacterium]|jgi:hypothetical protein|nr:dockerin type I repeat-containing protein [Clostridiales Family XIII bacterium]
MKTRWLVSLLLAAVFVCVTALPVYADEADPPVIEEIIVLHGGETLTTSATGQGSDPSHTRVVYQLATDAAGVITFTPDPHNNALTIIGNGVDQEPNNVTLSIARGINLTIQDVYLAAAGDTPLIHFNGIIGNSNLLSNQLLFEGTNALENETGGKSALVRVAEGVDLSILGEGSLYLYKNGGGAGIGGNAADADGGAAEAHGKITVAGGNLFLKGSGAGALLGSGGGTGPAGEIVIKDGNVNAVTQSQAAAIGGGAGSSGGSVLLQGGNVTVTTDGAGPAVGGGSLTVTGGSLKAVATENAAALQGVPAGLTYEVVSATMQGGGDPPAALGLLKFDTVDLSQSADVYTVLVGSGLYYQGGVHGTSYNPAAPTGAQAGWPESGDSQLYLWIPKAATSLRVNGEPFTLVWNEGAGAFTCTPGGGGAEGVWDGTVDTSWYSPGTQEYWLTTGAQLAGLARIVNGTASGIARDDFTGRTITLGSDLDLNNIPWTAIGTGDITIQYSWTNPQTGQTDSSLTNVIDSVSKPFNGTFNGNKKTITGLKIDTNKQLQGLFGYLGANGKISRISLEGTLTTTTSGDAVGSLVGFNRGAIDHYTGHVEIEAATAYNVGGVVGFNDGRTGNGKVEYSVNYGNVHGYVKVGGVAGQNAGLIKSCCSTGRVNGTNASSKNGVGGIAGRNGNNNTPVEVGTIIDCFSTAEIGRDGGQKWVGGIAGFQNMLSNIENCYFAGSFPNWNNNTNNPILGYSDVPALTDIMNINNYALNTLPYSNPNSPPNPGEIGIQRTEQHMKTAAFVTEVNGTGGVGRAFLFDVDNINGGYPVLRGLHVEDTATPVSISVLSDPDQRVPESWGTTSSKYCYYTGERFDTTGYLAVVNYSDGTRAKVYGVDVEVDPSGEIPQGLTSVTVTARFGTLSAVRTYPVDVRLNELVRIWFAHHPRQTIYASGERFNMLDVELRAEYTNGTNRALSLEEFTYEPATLHTGDTKVTIHYVYNGKELTVSTPVTVLSSVRPDQNDDGAYMLSTPDDVIWFMVKVNDGAAVTYDAVLLNDIDLRGAALFRPIGKSTAGYEYAGDFDGAGHALTLGYESTGAASGNYVGVFGYINGGSVRNLTVKGTIAGYAYVGGIAGAALDANIENCTNEAAVQAATTSSSYLGGIVGSASASAISECVNKGAVQGNSYMGGIVGSASGDTGIASARNEGAVTASGYRVGGIVGNVAADVNGNLVLVVDSENTGSVSGTYHVGGVAGYHGGTGIFTGLRNAGTVRATTATGTTTYAAGGLVGYVAGTGGVRGGVNVGAVEATTWNTGGAVGFLSGAGTAADCYNGARVTGKSPRASTATGGIVGAVNNSGAIVRGNYNSGAIAFAPASGTYTAYVEPVIGQYKPSGSVNTANITNNYYAPGVVSGTVSLGTVVTPTNYTAVESLLRGITDEQIKKEETEAGDYPVLLSVWSGSAVQVGDVDGDGILSISDAVQIIRHLFQGAPLTEQQQWAADIDGSGDVTIVDAVALVQRLVSL